MQTAKYTYSNSHYKNWFFKSQPQADFQKTNFEYCSAYGAAILKIGFKMRIADIHNLKIHNLKPKPKKL